MIKASQMCYVPVVTTHLVWSPRKECWDLHVCLELPMRYQTLVFTMWNTQLLLSGQMCWLTKVLACEMLPECIPSPWFELTLQAPCKQLWCFYHAAFPWNGHNFNCSFLEGRIVSIWEGFHCNINWLVMPNNSNELSNVDIFIRHNSFVRAHTICFLIATEVTKLS